MLYKFKFIKTVNIYSLVDLTVTGEYKIDRNNIISGNAHRFIRPAHIDNHVLFVKL